MNPDPPTRRERRDPLAGHTRTMSFLVRSSRRLRPVRLGLISAAMMFPTTLFAPPTTPAPLRNFKMPVFNDAGTRLFDLSAAAFRTLSEDPVRVELTTAHVRMYDPDAPGSLDGQLFAATATYDHATQVVSGSGQIHAIYREIELFGDDWTYDAKTKSIVIKSNVVVTFPGELGPILR